jgi:hypothetical protein
MTNSFVSFLKHLGTDFKNGFKALEPLIGKATQIAIAAGPEIALFNPLLGSVFQTTVGVVVGVEQKFAAMGTQSGTGPQKLSEATTILAPLLTTALSDAGHTADIPTVQKYINAVVAFLNALPPPPPATAAPAPAA